MISECLRDAAHTKKKYIQSSGSKQMIFNEVLLLLVRGIYCHILKW